MSAIDKAIDVLAAVCDSPTPVRFSSLVSQLGLPKSTVHRLLTTLLDQQLVRFDPQTQGYSPGYRLLGFAYRTWSGSDIRQAAQGAMQALLAEAPETVHLAVLDGHEIIYVDKLDDPGGVRLYSAVGKRGPVYCTGVGKAILAFLPAARQDEIIRHTRFQAHTPRTLVDADALRAALTEIRARGWALDDGEHEEGIRCIAAPVFNFRGDVVASVSVTAIAPRLDDARVQMLAPRVQAAARHISAGLGWQTEAPHDGDRS